MSRQLITVNSLTPPSELAVLAINAAVALDVTSLDLGRLPEHVKAALYTEATTFSAPRTTRPLSVRNSDLVFGCAAVAPSSNCSGSNGF